MKHAIAFWYRTFGHTYYFQQIDGKEVCVVLDDSSQRILAGGEFDVKATENSIKLLPEALDSFGRLTSIREVMTDHGTNSMPVGLIKTATLKADLIISSRKIKLFAYCSQLNALKSMSD